MNTYSGTYTSLRPKYRGEIKSGIHTAAKEVSESEGTGYSFTSAFFDFFGQGDNNDSKQNCGERAAKILIGADSRNKPLEGEATPSDFLTYQELIEPPGGVRVL